MDLVIRNVKLIDGMNYYKFSDPSFCCPFYPLIVILILYLNTSNTSIFTFMYLIHPTILVLEIELLI